MNRKKRMVVLATGLGAYLGALALFGVMQTASAVSLREVHSAYCHFGTDDAGPTLENKGSILNLGTTTRQVYCPYPNDNLQFGSDINGFRVDGVEGTNGATSRTCSSYINTNQFLCSAASSWTNVGPGVVVQGLSTTEWGNNNQVEYHYVRHDLTQNSRLYGMTSVGP